MSQTASSPHPEAVDPSGVDHAKDYGQGARRTAITEVQPGENATEGLAHEQRSGFASAEGRQGPASEGGGH